MRFDDDSDRPSDADRESSMSLPGQDPLPGLGEDPPPRRSRPVRGGARRRRPVGARRRRDRPRGLDGRLVGAGSGAAQLPSGGQFGQFSLPRDGQPDDVGVDPSRRRSTPASSTSTRSSPTRRRGRRHRHGRHLERRGDHQQPRDLGGHAASPPPTSATAGPTPLASSGTTRRATSRCSSSRAPRASRR